MYSLLLFGPVFKVNFFNSAEDTCTKRSFPCLKIRKNNDGNLKGKVTQNYIYCTHTHTHTHTHTAYSVTSFNAQNIYKFIIHWHKRLTKKTKTIDLLLQPNFKTNQCPEWHPLDLQLRGSLV